MDLFQIMGTIALQGADSAISDLTNVSNSAESTASSVESASKTMTNANGSTSSSFGSLLSSVQAYKAEGMSTSQAWKQATADMKANTESSSSSMVSAFKRIGTAVTTYLAVNKIVQFGKECVNAWQIQETAELKLETIMKQRMNASDEMIKSVKNLTKSEQELGVVGDEAQISGAQQLATFLNTSSALEKLIPAMNNLAVQQNGYNVSSESMVSIGNLMGKVMQGQVSALSRVGISFTEAQEKVLKYGTEEEKASVLAQVITDNVGDMNRVLAQTDSGKIQQAKNRMGDLKEQVGQALMPTVAKFYDMVSGFYQFTLTNVIPVIQTVGNFLENNQPIIEGVAYVVGVLTVALGAYTISQNSAVIATTISTMATTAFGSAMAFITAPITGVVLAIGAVIGAGILLYKNWDTVKAKTKELGNFLKSKWNEVKTNTVNKFNEIKTGVVNKFNELKTGAVEKVNSLVTSASEKFNTIKTKITEPIESAKTKIKGVVDSITGFFKNMNIQLPKIKLPHFSVTGSLSIAPPSVPKLSIDWYKKAMDEPVMFTEPTLFSYNPLTGSAKGAGEVGDEVMLGKNTMLNMIRTAVASENVTVEGLLNRIITLLVQFFPEALQAMDRPLVLDTGVLVSETAPLFDKELGKIAIKKGRGR